MVTHSAAHPFLDGTVKTLFIDGQFVATASERTIDSLNPATGSIMAQVAEGGAADIDLVVAAERRAFEGQGGDECLGMSGYGPKGGRRHFDEYLNSRTARLKF